MLVPSIFLFLYMYFTVRSSIDTINSHLAMCHYGPLGTFYLFVFFGLPRRGPALKIKWLVILFVPGYTAGLPRVAPVSRERANRGAPAA